MNALTTPEAIADYQLVTLKVALGLEIAGMKKRGPSAYALLKKKGYKGTKAEVMEQVKADVAENRKKYAPAA